MQLDFHAVTRPAQQNDSQKWIVNGAEGWPPGYYTIKQVSSGRFLQATVGDNPGDYGVVTHPAPHVWWLVIMRREFD